MLKNLLIALVVLVFAAVNISAQNAVKDSKSSKDEIAIREIVKQLENGWNAHDGKAFAAPFAPDADYVIVNGLYIKGRDAIEKGHTGIFTTVYKDSRNAGTVKTVRFLRPDVAVVHVEWNLEYSVNGESKKGHAMNTLILTRENGKWSIAAFHNTPILPPENRK